MRRKLQILSGFALLPVLVMAGCTPDSASSTSLSVLTYDGDVNLDASQISGTLEDINGCLAIRSNEDTTLIAVNHEQKSHLLEMLTSHDLNIGDKVDLPGSKRETESPLGGTDVCQPTDNIWLLGDINTILQNDQN